MHIRPMPSVKQIINDWGGAAEMSRALRLPLQTVYSWMLRDAIPATRVIDVERLTGVPRHKLRPDIFPAPPRGPRAKKAATYV